MTSELVCQKRFAFWGRPLDVHFTPVRILRGSKSDPPISELDQLWEGFPTLVTMKVSPHRQPGLTLFSCSLIIKRSSRMKTALMQWNQWSGGGVNQSCWTVLRGGGLRCCSSSIPTNTSMREDTLTFVYLCRLSVQQASQQNGPNDRFKRKSSCYDLDSSPAPSLISQTSL